MRDPKERPRRTAVPPLFGTGDVDEAWELFVSLVESMPVVPYIDAPDEQRTLYVGPQAKALLGVDVESGGHVEYAEGLDRVHPQDRERAVAETARLMEAGGGSQEWRFIRPDNGETVWVEERLSVVEVGGRRLTPGVLIDITQAKQAEAEIAVHVRELERVNHISKAFTELVVDSGDVTAIVDLLADLIGCPVVLTDAIGATMAAAGGAPASGDDPGIERSVRLRGERWGRLTLLLDRPVETADELAIDQACTAIALALLLEREASLIQESARSALVNDLSMARITSGRELLRRARSLGVDLGRGPLRVVVAEPVTSPTQSKGRERMRQRMRRHVEVVAEALGSPALVGSEGDRAIGVMAQRRPWERSDLDARLSRSGTRVGVSDLVDGDGLCRAYQQAVDALEHAALRLPDSGARAVAHFSDLGLSQLLARLADGPDLTRFVDSELGPLLQHDRTRGATLMPTLAAFLGESGSKSAAAKRLGVERRTVYYRLERIGTLLGRDLDDPETRLRLEVALRGWEVLEAVRTER